MAIICSAAGVEFPAAAGVFQVRVSNGAARLLRKPVGSSVFAPVKREDGKTAIENEAIDCNNAVASTVYIFELLTPGALVEAAQ